eukprot:Em0001g1724a
MSLFKALMSEEVRSLENMDAEDGGVGEGGDVVRVVDGGAGDAIVMGGEDEETEDEDEETEDEETEDEDEETQDEDEETEDEDEETEDED